MLTWSNIFAKLFRQYIRQLPLKPFTQKGNIREFCQLAFACTKLTIETLEFKVNNRIILLTTLWCLYFTFKHTSHCVLAFLLLPLSTWMLAGFVPMDEYIWLFFRGWHFFIWLLCLVKIFLILFEEVHLWILLKLLTPSKNC